MHPIGPEPTLLWVRITGALAGAVVSLVYMFPHSAREAAARAIAGVVSGLVFGAPTGVVLAKWMAVSDALAPDETLLMGSAAASLSAWWALGALARMANRAGRGQGPKA